MTAQRDLVSELEAQAQRRFVRWDAELWRAVCAGPARQLAARLDASGIPAARGEALLESYLKMASEGIGLGYLFPADAAGSQNFFTLAFTHLIPRLLPALPPERQGETLAQCWNLGENLEASPTWLRRIFLRLCASSESLADLPSLVARVSHETQDEPPRKLAQTPRIEWINLADEDPRFLPGNLHFVAPTVVCVHDRHRTAAGGRDAVSVGAWLVQPPLPLGSMGCTETPPPDTRPSLELLEALEKRDPRAADWRAMARNDWRAAVTLETSQFLVALLPA